MAKGFAGFTALGDADAEPPDSWCAAAARRLVSAVLPLLPVLPAPRALPAVDSPAEALADWLPVEPPSPSAHATGLPEANAAPIPNATAKPPTRPIYADATMDCYITGHELAAETIPLLRAIRLLFCRQSALSTASALNKCGSTGSPPCRGRLVALPG